MPALSAARRVARAGRAREGRAVPRRDVLGPAGAGLRRPGRADPARSAWRRRRTAATGPAGSSPATRRATSCSRRCTPSGSRTSRSARRADDGLTLTDAYIAAAVRCAPPANKPTTEERDNCRRSSSASWRCSTEVRVVVALGAFGWDAALRAIAALRAYDARPRPRFGHGAEARDRAATTLARHVPPEPAEHVHRPPDPADARRGPRPGVRSWRQAPTRQPAADVRVEPVEDDAVERRRRVDEPLEHRHPVAAPDALGMHRDRQQAARARARARSAAPRSRSRGPSTAPTARRRPVAAARSAASRPAPSRPAPRRARPRGPNCEPSVDRVPIAVADPVEAGSRRPSASVVDEARPPRPARASPRPSDQYGARKPVGAAPVTARDRLDASARGSSRCLVGARARRSPRGTSRGRRARGRPRGSPRCRRGTSRACGPGTNQVDGMPRAREQLEDPRRADPRPELGVRHLHRRVAAPDAVGDRVVVERSARRSAAGRPRRRAWWRHAGAS